MKKEQKKQEYAKPSSKDNSVILSECSIWTYRATHAVATPTVLSQRSCQMMERQLYVN